MMMRKSRPYIGKTLIYTDRMLRIAGRDSDLSNYKEKILPCNTNFWQYGFITLESYFDILDFIHFQMDPYPKYLYPQD